jgi:acyl-CoA synthetase (AMP-forming)/AMP-acid ligase II
VRSGQVCAGYWDDPEATAAAIVDGWLRTGDVGVLDDDGLLTIVDRAKDIVVTGGENVASREVEDVVGSHPAIARVAVVGLPDPRWGEAVCAAVVLRPAHDRPADDVEADVIAHARARLAGYKVPKRVVVLDDLPTNAGGKVVKPELRRLLADDVPS